MTGIKLKICGVKDPQNLISIIDYCDYVGVIIDKETGSPRAVSEETAEHILRICEKFNKTPIALVASSKGIDLAHRLGFNIVQIHSPDRDLIKYAVSLGLRIVPVFISKSSELQKSELAEFLSFISNYSNCIEFVLLDADKSLKPVVNGLKLSLESYRIFIDMCHMSSLASGVAGGITPENVRDIVSMRPDVIDVSSGVEVNVGVKSVEKVRMLRRRILEYGQ